MGNSCYYDMLKEYSRNLGLEIKDEQCGKFEKYALFLQEWNEKINLTAITEDTEICIKHFYDSLTVFPYIKGNNLIDVGTGAGFPGIPLKIIFPELKITLLDSLEKRVNFLNEVCTTLNLTEIEAIHSRAEDAGRNAIFREQYDICISRAVAKLPVLLEYCLPFVKVGGIFIAMKGREISEIDESQKALELLGGQIEDVKEPLI